jgi:hypothetical protein
MPYKYREDLYKAQKKHRIRIRTKLYEYLSDKKCIDCGEDDPIVLEFDHQDPKTKIKNVASMLSGHYSWSSVLSEIMKCKVRCANCHRRKTYIESGSFGRSKPL